MWTQCSQFESRLPRFTVVLSLFAKSERDALVVSRHMTTPTECGNKMAATSIEPSRVRAYHDNLKWRMVYQQEALKLPYTIIAKNLGIDTATVWRTTQRFEKTGSVSKKQYTRDNLPRKVSEMIKLVVLHIVLENPGIYLREIQSKVEHLTGSDLLLSTICHLLQEQHFSRKKMKLIARQRDEFTRAIYAAEVPLYNPEMFIFLDETGSDRCNALRKYGYSF